METFLAKQACVAVGTAFRRRVWELEEGRHCSVLGTCLTLGDLHVIGRRAGYRFDPGVTPYKLHSWFVDMMLYQNDVSKLVDKALEKRHAKAAHRMRQAKTEAEIEPRFKQISAEGEIAGAYWGAMSHPLCSSETAWKIFGDIHMLSHLVGASRQKDLSHVHELEKSNATLDAKLAQLTHDHRCGLKDKKRLEDDADLFRRESELFERRVVSAQARIAELEAGSLVPSLEARLAELERLLLDTQQRAIAAEDALATTRSELGTLREDHTRASEQVRDLTAENEALENELTSAMICPFALRPQEAEEDARDLATLTGRRILCVGGVVGLVPHYRALVERRGGEFLHHDGGVEDSMDAVTRALSTVDVVVCPIDFVSHAACLKVKKACKNLAIPFLPLRSSGLSSFARGIRSLAMAPTQ